MNGPVNVLIADDHARTRALVREALERSGEFVVCEVESEVINAVLMFLVNGLQALCSLHQRR